jgi:DNA-binding CsgD family transcriptional regulator
MKLSVREQEVLKLISKGYQDKQIAFEMNLSENTVKVYVRQILRKCSVRNRTELLSKCAKEIIVGVSASLAAAISLLESGGKQAAGSDTMFDIMISDYKRSLEAAKAYLT